jgi:hypothetical protein
MDGWMGGWNHTELVRPPNNDCTLLVSCAWSSHVRGNLSTTHTHTGGQGNQSLDNNHYFCWCGNVNWAPILEQ